jgi:hypothetical protein
MLDMPAGKEGMDEPTGEDQADRHGEGGRLSG